MIIDLYIDLPNDYISEPKMVYANSVPSTQKMEGWSRYKIEVDLPIHHFKSINDRVIKAVTIGKEED